MEKIQLPDFLQSRDEMLATGRLCLQGNHLSRAMEICAELAGREPANADLLCLLAEIELARQQPEKALEQIMQGLILAPENPDCRRICGVIYEALARPDAAAGEYREALRLNPVDSTARLRLARLEKARGNLGEAAELLGAVVEAEPDNAEALAELAATFYQLNRFGEARERAEAALNQAPDTIVALQTLCATAMAAGNHKDAVEHCDRVIMLRPADSSGYVMKASALMGQGLAGLALPASRRAVQLNPDNVEALRSMAICLVSLGWWVDVEVEEAIFQLLDRALQLDPDNIDLLAVKADFFERTGNAAAAFEIVDRLCGPQTTNVNIQAFGLFLSLAAKFQRAETARLLIDRFLPDIAEVPAQHAFLLFAAGEFYDRTADYDKAFACFKKANAAAGRKYDRVAIETRVDKAMAAFVSEPSGEAPSRPGPAMPIFIVGTPRSGTSLTEKILTSHPDVLGAGELGAVSNIAATLGARIGTEAAFPECVTELDRQVLDQCVDEYFSLFDPVTLRAHRFITDKSLDNAFNLGLIQLLFPESPIIYCRRDPRDVAVSCYMKNFAAAGMNFSYDLTDIAHYQHQYLRLMAHWQRLRPARIHELHYETLVADLEAETRTLLDFCGLSWNPACLEPHRSSHVTATASHGQTNRPIYRHSIARWKNYEQYLEPFLTEFNRS